jgi:hypothetical protein
MNNGFYIQALSSLNGPAKASEIHQRAVEMFGNGIGGGLDSVRNSMQRYIAQGRVYKVGRGLFDITGVEVDPVRKLDAELRIAQAEIERLRERLRQYEPDNA